MFVWRGSGLAALLSATALALMLAPAELEASSADVVVLKPDSTHFVIMVNIEQLDFSTIIEGGTEYQKIYLNRMIQAGETGRPSLPHKNLFLEIPYGVTPEGEIASESWVSGGDGHLIYPMQPIEAMSEPLPPFTIDHDFYQVDAFGPEQKFEIVETGYARGRRLINLRIYPVKYNPVSGEVKYSQNMEIRLDLVGPIDQTGVDTRARLHSPAFDQTYIQVIENYEQANFFLGKKLKKPKKPKRPKDKVELLAARSLSGLWSYDYSSGAGADYLILTHNSFKDAVIPLADWTTLKGYKVMIATVGQEPGDLPPDYDSIKAYIQHAFDNWNPAPTHLLIVGDAEHVPAYDMEYTWMTINGITDMLPDMFAGRISVDTAEECTTVVKKILKYEGLCVDCDGSFPDVSSPMDVGGWYNISLIAATLEMEAGSQSGIICSDSKPYAGNQSGIGDQLEDKMQVNEIYMDLPTHCTPWYSTELRKVERYQKSPDELIYDLHYIPMPEDVWLNAHEHMDDLSAKAEFLDIFNNGVGLVSENTHGFPDQIKKLMDSNDVANLQNGDRTPVFLAFGCYAGTFTISNDECWAEKILRKNNGGVVGVVAKRDPSYIIYNQTMAQGMIYSLWPETDIYSDLPFEPPSRHVPAEALTQSKYFMDKYLDLNCQDCPSARESMLRYYYWFGDPVMMIRTDTPHALSVSHNPSIRFGATVFEITVTAAPGYENEFVRAALVQNGEILGVVEEAPGTSAPKSIKLAMDPPLYDASPVFLTSVSYNAIPYEVILDVSVNSDAVVTWSRDNYFVKHEAEVIVADANAGLPLKVDVWAGRNPGARKTITLHEDPAGSGIFRAPVSLDESPGAGIDLAVSEGDIIYAEYIDVDDGSGGMGVVKQAQASVGPGLVYSFPLDDPGPTTSWTTMGQWELGPPSGVSGANGTEPGSAFTGPNVYAYDLDADYQDNMGQPDYLSTSALDLSGYVNNKLRFRRWLGIQNSRKDHAIIEMSVDGLSWVPVWEHSTGNVMDSAWESVKYALPLADNQSTVYVRWGMGPTDASVTYPGWNIDDIEIVGYDDWDRDGLADLFEISIVGTDPYDLDTDYDYYSDGDEVGHDGDRSGYVAGADTDPLNPDTDSDGALDGKEVHIHNSDPLDPDTDDDGMDDGIEASHPCLVPTLNDINADPDGDGLENIIEIQNVMTDPCNQDTDEDGMDDNWETSNGCMDPLTHSADDDFDGDSLTNLDEYNNSPRTNPCVTDTDGDGMDDGYEALHSSCLDPVVQDESEDGDGDGLINSFEYLLGTDPCNVDTDQDGLPDYDEQHTYGTNPANPDTDGDGISDGVEIPHVCLNALNRDTDGDNLPDLFEFNNSSNTPPLNPCDPSDNAADFDGDGNPNVHEYFNGSDPWIRNNPGSPGCHFWGEAADGNGIPGLWDLAELEIELTGIGGDYYGVIPPSSDVQDLDANGRIGLGDLSILEFFMTNHEISSLGSRPKEIQVAFQPGSTVAAGNTTRVSVHLLNENNRYTSGFGVVFTIGAESTGSAILLGGDGEDSGGRYDFTMHQPDALATIVLLIESPGAIYLNVSVPKCGTDSLGKSAPAMSLPSPVVIATE